MSLHASVRTAVVNYLAAVDAGAPGLVEGLYLTGSAVLDDFRAGASDVDFVAVMGERADELRLAALERVHARLARLRGPSFDGDYVTWADLAADPALAAPGPRAHDGRLHRSVVGGRHPVTWHMLARHGVALRGPEPRDVAVSTDPGALDAWTRRNLDAYWRRWWRRSRRLPSRAGLAALGAWAPAWGVLGVSRLHHTLATAAITSKSGAGEWALGAFEPRWRRIVEECLRIRRGAAGRSLYRSPLARRHEALAFMEMAIEAAHRLPRRM